MHELDVEQEKRCQWAYIILEARGGRVGWAAPAHAVMLKQQLKGRKMDTNSMKESLKSLHANLEATRDVDPELKELLQALDNDIHQLLRRDQDAASSTEGLVRRAQEISARLAVRHPHIEPALREVADALGRMGI
jgi:chromosome segregation ATPase